MLPRPLTHPRRSSAVLAAVLTALAVVAMLLVDGQTLAPRAAVPASSVAVLARAVTPTTDFPRLPRECVKPKDKIPQKPGRCDITDFQVQRPTIVLWGDSHAYHHIPAIRQAVRGQNVNFLVFIAGACPPMVRHTDEQDTCSTINRQALAFVTRLHDNGRQLTVLVGSYWHWYLSTLERIDAGEEPEADETYIFKQSRKFRLGVPRLFRTLGRMRVDTDVIGPTPTVPDVVDPCPEGQDPYACRIKRGRALPDERKTRAYVETQMKALRGRPRLINLKARICDSQYCYGRRDGVYTWYDAIHLSATFSRSTASYFRGIVRDVKR